MEIFAVKKKTTRLLVFLLLVFCALQFFNRPRTNPPIINNFVTATRPPAELQNLFRAACYDCHSHETRWPWYSRIAPMSWSIANDVEYGRANLDLSDWPTNSVRAAKKLTIMSDDIQSGDMPMKKYRLIHRDARLTDDQRKQLAEWLDATAEKLQTQDETAR